MGRKIVKCTDSFIAAAVKRHGEAFIYSRVKYVDAKSKVDIFCPNHGWFKQTPAIHLRSYGCPECGREAIYKSKIEKAKAAFVFKAMKVHGNKYDYSKSDYKQSNKLVKIFCRKHGVFEQQAGLHLRGSGCPDCAKEDNDGNKVRFNEYVKKCRKFFPIGEIEPVGEWKGVRRTSQIRYNCPKHGWQTYSPRRFLKNKSCKACMGRVSSYEQSVEKYLKRKGVLFEREVSFDGCRYKNPLKFDFYLPSHGIIIEVHGEQHYEPVKIFGGNKAYLNRVKRDAIKRNFVKSRSDLLLVELSYSDVDSGKFRSIVRAAMSGNTAKSVQLRMAI